MKLKKYFILVFFSCLILGIINNIISFITYPLYAEANGNSYLFYLLMNFVIALFHSFFIIAIYMLMRDRMPGKGILKGIFYGIFVIWLFGPVFPLSYEFAFKLTVSLKTLVFTLTSLITWIIYSLILEFLFFKIYINNN